MLPDSWKVAERRIEMLHVRDNPNRWRSGHRNLMPIGLDSGID